MDEMIITSAQYVSSEDGEGGQCIECQIDGKRYVVPIAAGNRHYDEIMRQVEAGTLTITEADQLLTGRL